MIIRADTGSLLFITQPDHAGLAAAAIASWQSDDFPGHPRRAVILEATREHDNGWIEEDAATHVDGDGAPLDFVAVPPAVRQRIWPRAVERMAARSPYAAALIAQHAIAVYSSNRTDEGWASFFATMIRQRDDLAARARTPMPTLDADYRFVHAADRLSLAFCTGWTHALESHGRRIILKGRKVEITPDPFAGARVPLVVRARRVAARRYASTADLRAALEAAPVEYLEGEASGQA